MDNTQQVDKVYRVPDANLAMLQQRIEKLAERARKLDVPLPILTVIRVEDMPLVRPGEATKILRVHHVTVTGQAPKLAGWTFAAVLQPTVNEDGAATGNLLRVVPGFSGIPAQFRNAEMKCDHCHIVRRRNETFVLVSDAGEWKQVGRQCLRDFLGHQSPKAYASWAEILIDAADLAGSAENDDFDRSGRVIEHYAAEDILTLGTCAIRLYGFRSNKTAREYGKQPTSAAVVEWLYASRDARLKWEFPLEPNDADRQQAADVFGWMQTLSDRADDLNDYFYNLSLLGRGATFTARNFGLAISAIAVWSKEQEREVNRLKRFEEDSASEYVGELGKRSTFENLTLVYTQDFPSDFGVSHMYKFKDANGNVVVWFASSELWNETRRQNIEVGDAVTLVARVKRHDMRNGVKQTTITRAAVPTVKIPKARPALMRTIAWG